jgi:methionine-gamma-lyase
MLDHKVKPCGTILNCGRIFIMNQKFKAKAVQAIRDVQHFGEEGGVVPVIDVAATSTFLDPEDMEKAFRGEVQGCYLYSRHTNPSNIMFGKKLAAMEGMEAALGVASGMAAIASTVEQLMEGHGHILSSNVVYGGTYALFANILPKRGIEVSFIDPRNLAEVEASITAKTKLLYVETMSNPLLAISDLKGLGELAKRHGLSFVVDNTFTPLIVSPAEFGADVIVYSCTKYISGASDLIAGAVISSEKFISRLIDVNDGIVMLTGPVIDARIAQELYLRLDHLPLRIKAHSQSAEFFSKALAHRNIPVIYPGLPIHPEHELFNRIRNPEFGYGGMLTLDCQTPKKAMQLARELQDVKFGLYAVSLGFSRTLMSCPANSTSSEIPADEQKKIGLSPGLLRLSIGYTGENQEMLDRFLKSYEKVFLSARNS